MSAEGAVLEIWTIYRRPTDYPDHFVARCWEVTRGRGLPTERILLSADLELLRAMLPPGLFCLSRNAKDDPVIVESWL
jgi:hypothetical protein